MSDLAVSLLILITFATGLSTGYYCGHAKGRVVTLADLQRVSESLAKGMSAGSAHESYQDMQARQAMGRNADVYPNSPQTLDHINSQYEAPVKGPYPRG